MDSLVAAGEADGESLPISLVVARDYKAWHGGQDPTTQAWLDGSGFKGKAGTHALIPGEEGQVQGVVLVVDQLDAIWDYAGLPRKLPPGHYFLDTDLGRAAAERAALGWALGSYSFDRYKRKDDGEAPEAKLIVPEAADHAGVTRLVEAIELVRDLVNTPAGDMGPAELAEAVRTEAKAHGAKTTIIAGEQLLKKDYPAIHAVGRASSREPRLIDLRWNDGGGPQITLVGKGVVFDTGGLDLKNASGMRLMKKDMGGAAHALALAKLIMGAQLRVSLRLLIPAVENSVSGDAFRPGDILNTRAGKTVEIGNTDAEGRLVMADALAEAAKDKPELLIDFATLTGAARTALGPEIAALFCNDEALAERLLSASETESDPIWRLPLYAGYRRNLDSSVADICNIADNGYAGATIAGLFLQEFVPKGAAWAHFDVMAWNPTGKPGRPKGGEAMGLRGAFKAVSDWARSQTGKA
jgi:leucyl aminopeptidase